MKKREVRCFLIYTKVGSQYNVEIFYPCNGGWANFSLFTCLKCGELFAADNVTESSNLLHDVLSTHNLRCPQCGSSLNQTLANYPSSFLAPDGSIGNFKAPIHFPADWQTKFIEVWDITYLFV